MRDPVGSPLWLYHYQVNKINIFKFISAEYRPGRMARGSSTSPDGPPPFLYPCPSAETAPQHLEAHTPVGQRFRPNGPIMPLDFLQVGLFTWMSPICSKEPTHREAVGTQVAEGDPLPKAEEL